MTVIIDDATVRQTIDMSTAIEQLRSAYLSFAQGDIVEAARVNIPLPTGFLRLMAASWPSCGLAGYKEFHRCNGQVRYTYHLIDQESGENLAMIDANHLTALRTGACGGLAADVLARKDARKLGVIGSGSEARTQIEAIRAVRPIESVVIFSPRVERRESLASELRAEGIEARTADEPTAAVADADIIAVATNTGTRGPAFAGNWLTRPGVHVNSIGSTLPSQREIDEHTWSAVDRIVIDTALLLHESGDAIAADKAGFLDRERIALLGDVVAGVGRARADSERTLYKSVGSPLQDLALAAFVYRALEGRSESLAFLADYHQVAVMAS
ncbi:ornithine cyclodeaminase family protein [Streptomyces sp. NBC_01320]|uniref:ornithine cyclodeaminase family protein n=1 Tax=Streptomyces sp. NBC_01320 TaxID=2903824 RepID=UPI002E124F2E|nr:ornithine cyclodeaminase family protein [Streptomyces sp. NBC_01320]WSK01143.1 ornithine cyclodeaminase family protein [Streptomyces sp. NBC_01320]